MHEENERLIAYLLQWNYIDERIAAAMRAIPRGLFVPQQYKGEAYIDHPLPIGFGQTISAPSIVGTMTRALDVKEGQKILEVGSGSGWQAAILGHLVGATGTVYTIERIPSLLEMAKANIAKVGLTNIKFILGDGTLGYREAAPYDRIIVTAGAPAIPPPLLEQLKRGGKLVIPVGAMFWQDLLLIEKNEQIKEFVLLPVMFVPLIGQYGYREEL